jgi:four helix bundle protein
MDNPFIISYRELRVYQTAFDNALLIFERSPEFPPEALASFTPSMIGSSRLVCINIAQAWQKRRYQSAFIAKLNQAEAEAATTQVWIEFAVLCNYLDAETGQELHHNYQEILADLSRLIQHAAAWEISN